MHAYFIRHGETKYNRNHRLMGQRIDAPLDEIGLQQAHAVIAKLPRDFAAIYTSPLKRAAQTAQVIADYFDRNLEVRQELKERDFGSLTGKTWDEIDQETGLDMSGMDLAHKYDYTPYGGESVDHVRLRLQLFLDEIRAKHPRENVIVITHFGIIGLMGSMFQRDLHHELKNASVHMFVI